MRNLKWLMLFAFIFLIIGGAGSLFTFNATFANEDATEKEEVDMQTITTIDVSSSNEEVILKETDGKTATIEWTGKVKKDTTDRLSTQTDGDTLTIDMKQEELKLFSFGFDFYQGKLVISLPKKVYEAISVQNANGSIHVTHTQADKLDIMTNNGTINLQQLATNAIQAETANGKVIVKNVTGDITGHSNNGSLTLITPELDRNVDLKTNNGKITVQTEKVPTNAKVEADTDNGSIEIFGEEIHSKIYGNGDQHIKLKTNNGSITMENK